MHRLKTDGEAPAFGDTSIYGLTKREWLAGMAMQGHIAARGLDPSYEDEAARLSVKQADALIAALNEGDRTHESAE